MKRTLEGMALAGEPLLRQALETIRALHRAEDAGASADELARLRLLADSLYHAVVDHQLLVTGDCFEAIH